MTLEKLKQATEEIAQYRQDIIKRLLQYAGTDLLLFWGTNKDLVAKQEKLWQPLLEWAKEEFQTQFVKTQQLDVPIQDKQTGVRLKLFLESLSDKELAAYYLAALNMRSVLLAAALVKGRITAKQAFEAAYLEELYQAEVWGSDDEAEAKRQERLQELCDIEKFLHS